MPIRVLHIATGNVGRIALSQLIEDPRFELVGLVVSDLAKVGRDAGELARLDAVTGIVATDDLAAVRSNETDCAVYCALAETRFFEALDDIRKLLASGANVVASSPVPLVYPWGLRSDTPARSAAPRQHRPTSPERVRRHAVSFSSPRPKALP